MPTIIDKPMTPIAARLVRANPTRARGDRAAGTSRNADARFWRWQGLRKRDRDLVADQVEQLAEAPLSLIEAVALVESDLEPYSSDLDPALGDWEHIACCRVA